MQNKISLNQIGVLRGILTDKFNEAHMVNFDLSNLEKVMSGLSEKQYKYIRDLIIFHKNWIKAKTILNQCGLKNKSLE